MTEGRIGHRAGRRERRAATARAQLGSAGFAIAVLLWATAATEARGAGPEFFAQWSDGRGEINTYQLREERYGEVREGNAVLVYVAEELDRDTYVKVESDSTPPEKRMYVIKLNQLRRFPTGLYDYSAMTTVFSVADSHLGHPPFQAARVVLTAQEWCGQVFQRFDLRDDGWHYDLRSYFEAEADREEILSAEGTDLEDNLWVKIRELDQRWLEPGQSRSLRLIPSAWETRKTHHPPRALATEIRKGEETVYESGIGSQPAFPWSWAIEDRQVTVWVESAGAHRLLGWQDSRGGSGRLIESRRLPYWRLNGAEEEPLRSEFGLPSSRPTR